MSQLPEESPFLEAVMRDDVDAALNLLEGGADPDEVGTAGFTALHFAAQNYQPRLVRALIIAGAAVDPLNRYGATPLWTATMKSRGRGEVIKLLLEAGADPDCENSRGISPRGLASTIANYDLGQFFPPEQAR